MSQTIVQCIVGLDNSSPDTWRAMCNSLYIYFIHDDLYSSSVVLEISICFTGVSSWWLYQTYFIAEVFQETAILEDHEENINIQQRIYLYGSGHGTVTVLLPGFAINW